MASRTITAENYKYYSCEQRDIPDLQVLSIDATIRDQPTRIDEIFCRSCLVYATPVFKAEAHILFPPIEDDTHWRIGFIQACNRMQFDIFYGKSGVSSWEFPIMKSGERSMINDSDSRNFPFYDALSSSRDLRGPINTSTQIYLRLTDHFNPYVPWKSVRMNGICHDLTFLQRDQSFLVWLVALNLTTRKLVVIKTISWEMHVRISVDTRRRIGSRAVLVSNPKPVEPTIFFYNVPIPFEVLYPPTANSAQVLTWRGNDGTVRLLVPPKFYDERENRQYSLRDQITTEESSDGDYELNDDRSCVSSASDF
ncbi:hypothetical protein ACOME3_004884 [Neoechinorhynchus agilis]